MFDKNKPQTFKNSSETDQDINENILDLSDVIDEIFNLILREINEGKEEKLIKKHVFNYINNHEIILPEIYNWLLLGFSKLLKLIYDDDHQKKHKTQNTNDLQPRDI